MTQGTGAVGWWCSWCEPQTAKPLGWTAGRNKADLLTRSRLVRYPVYFLLVGVVGCLQSFPAPRAAGQTIQLPTLNWFSVNTSVLAPDRGGTYLGGWSRSQESHTQFGTPGSGVPGLGRLTGNRAWSHRSGGGGTSVHTTVVDHAQWDRAVLAEARRRRSVGEEGPDRFSPALADFSTRISGSVQSDAAAAGRLPSVAEIQQQHARRRSLQQEEAKRLLARGLDAQEQGSLVAAKVYFQMAQRRAQGDLEREITRCLERVTHSINSAKASR
jgi:hypothetical protein